jgi:hypothetical protein
VSSDTGIPEDTGTWGKNHLETDNPYRIIGEQLFSFISCDELASMSGVCHSSFRWNDMLKLMITITLLHKGW